MTEFEKTLEPIENWIEEKLKGRLPYSKDIDVFFCAALIKQYQNEQLLIHSIVVPKGTLCDLDGKTVRVKFKVTKHIPKIVIEDI